MNIPLKNNILNGVPGWGLALLSVMFAVILLNGLVYVLSLFKGLTAVTGELIAHFIYILFIALAAYSICRRDYRSILCVLVFCNIVSIILATDQADFRSAATGIILYGVIFLSSCTTISGNFAGKRNEKTFKSM